MKRKNSVHKKKELTKCKHCNMLLSKFEGVKQEEIIMPATQFICPNGDKVDIEECLTKCKQGKRCMFLPTLRAIAKSLDRKIRQPSVTELIAGVRNTPTMMAEVLK